MPLLWMQAETLYKGRALCYVKGQRDWFIRTLVRNKRGGSKQATEVAEFKDLLIQTSRYNCRECQYTDRILVKLERMVN